MKKQFWSIENILSTDAEWNMIFGQRSNGKSFGMKEYLFKKFLNTVNNDTPSRFMLVRRYSDDITTFYINQYFQDLLITSKTNKKIPLLEWSKGRFNNIKIAQNKIFVSKVDENGKETDIQHCGYYTCIRNMQRQKGGSYLDVNDILYEEFIAFGTPYLPNECEQFENIVSTVSRNFRKIKVWLVGNNDARDCIYFNYFDLSHVRKQKENTIEIYEHKINDEQTVKFAVEFCGNLTEKSGMFFGHGSEVIESGNWKSEKQPTMNYEYFEKSKQLYHVVFVRNGFKWDAWFCQDKENNGFFWYVQEKTRPIFLKDRVISDEISTNPLYTHNMNPLSEPEKFAFELLKNDKVFFHDSLTGTEFKRAISYFFANNIYFSK